MTLAAFRLGESSQQLENDFWSKNLIPIQEKASHHIVSVSLSLTLPITGFRSFLHDAIKNDHGSRQGYFTW